MSFLRPFNLVNYDSPCYDHPVALKRFAKIYVEISNSCNLACDFCPSGVSDKQLKNSIRHPSELSTNNLSHKTFMSKEQLRSIFRDCRDLTEQFTFHVLGEPTAHPEFSEFIHLANEEKAYLNITTNGILVHVPNIQDALLNPTVRQVNFSLQSWTANFSIDKVQKYLVKIFDFIDRAEKERPDLYINLRLWNFGSPEENLLSNLHFLKPIEEKYQRVAENDKKNVRSEASGSKPTPLTEIKTNIEMKKSHKIRGRLYLHFDSRFEWPDPKSPVRSLEGHCYGLKNHLGILANGTVVPCCLDANGYINLGNIFETSLDEIISAPRAKKIYHGFEKHKLIEDLCQKCTYIERFDSKLQNA